MNMLFSYDEALRHEYPMICGADEAGRGPLAGPVFAACVVFPAGVSIDGVNDSKKLTDKKREKLFSEIIDKSLAYGIAYADEREIDRINILNAALESMRRAVMSIPIQIDLVLIDGNRLPDMDIPAKAIVGGDGISQSIAAASILAKVTRDRYMLALAEEYPEYALERHKGYPTKLHYERLLTYGATDIHRQSFLKKLKAVVTV